MNTESKRVVLASNNAGKLKEFSAILAQAGISMVPQGQLNIPEAEEPFATFIENALAKARHASQLSGLPALADDSGLSVAALDGAPGIFSARWAGPGKDFALAMQKVEERLQETGSTDRSAWFTSALAVAWPDGPCVVVEGRVDGQLVFPPRGDGGHGYDPIFQPEGSDKTFAEMDAAEKDAVSHRGRAFDRLKAALID